MTDTTGLDAKGSEAARNAVLVAFETNTIGWDGLPEDEIKRRTAELFANAAIRAYLFSSPPREQVTEATIERGLRAAEEHCMQLTFGKFREDSTFENAFTDDFKERFRSIHRAALLAALSQPHPADERVVEALVRASVALEPFAEIGTMMNIAGATEADDIEISGEQLRPALIAAAKIKNEIDAALSATEGR